MTLLFACSLIFKFLVCKKANNLFSFFIKFNYNKLTVIQYEVL